MQKIWKYEIPIREKFKIDMPFGNTIVKVDVVDGTPYMWVLFRNESDIIEYEFALSMTGGDVEADYIYAGTFIIGRLVFHLFELYDDIPF